MENPFANIMQQVAKSQENFKKIQDELKNLKIEGESGAGMVKLITNGNGEAIEMIIDESIYAEDKKVLNGLIIAAINDARIKRERARKTKMQELMSGLGLPQGFNFPFGD